MAMGPNYRNLVAVRGQIVVAPRGRNIVDAIGMIANRKPLYTITREAMEWVRDAIANIKAAPDNPCGDNEEAICGEILNQLVEAGAIRRK